MSHLKINLAQWMVAAALATAACRVATADDSAAPATAIDKSAFTLFNPTPRSAMREMATDRPDITESPISVDAGHVQVEMSLINYGRNRYAGERTDTLSIAPTNFKIGLLNNVDIQFVFTPYVNERTKSATGAQRTHGFSDDTQIRLKMNLWGNDGPSEVFGDTAFALMPYVKFPTGTGGLSNDHVEGGLILPLAVNLPGDFSLGLMGVVDLAWNDATGGYGVNFLHSATIAHDIPFIPNLAGYLEIVGIAPCETSATYRALASFGLTYMISENWMLDCGGTVGLSKSADDFTLFAGMSFRF